MDRHIGQYAILLVAIQIFSREGAVEAGSLHKHLDEQHFGDGVERCGRVFFMNVADDVMAGLQQARELGAVEGALRLFDFLDDFRVAPIRRSRNARYRFELSGRGGHDFERLREAAVMGNEKLRAHRARIAFALIVILEIEADAFRLALDHDLGRSRVGFVVRRSPNDNIGAHGLGARLRPQFLPHLGEVIAQFQMKVADELLPHFLFRLAR